MKFTANGMLEGERYMRAKVQKRLEMEPSQDVRDYIDAYLLEKQKHEKAGDSETYSGAHVLHTAHNVPPHSYSSTIVCFCS